MSTELEQIAASVAKALGIDEFPLGDRWLEHVPETALLTPVHIDVPIRSFYKDGSNLFDPYWQMRCRDFLLETGDVFLYSPISGHHCHIQRGAVEKAIHIDCAAAEFYARAIHELSREHGN